MPKNIHADNKFPSLVSLRFVVANSKLNFQYVMKSKHPSIDNSKTPFDLLRRCPMSYLFYFQCVWFQSNF